MANDKIESEGSQDLKKLIRNRGTIKQKLSGVEKFINKIKTTVSDNKPSLNDVELRFKDSSALLQDFDNIQSIIESLCEENDLDSHFKERENFQDRYYSTQDFLSTYIKSECNIENVSNIQSDTQDNNSANSRNNFDSLHNVLLPKLKLPSFSGNFEQWLNFKLSFISIIDSNANLTDLQKFQFLKASLEGYASRFVEGFEGLKKPYEQSWHNLCNKFDKKQFLLDTHFQQLLNVSQLNKENFYNFNIMLDQITKHVSAIESMKLNSKILFDSLIIHLLSGKFDKVSLREWKELEYDGDLPTLNEFQEFIKNKADLLQSLEQSYTVKPVQTTNHKPYYPNRYSNNSQVNVSLNNSVSYSVKCNFCKNDHAIYKCQKFLALSVKERFNNVRRLNLCQNCLRTGHSHDNCTFFPCKICKSNNKVLKHNTLLHINHAIRDQNQQNSQTLNMLVRPTIKSQSQIILSTIVCKVKGSDGHYHDCRALLDCGAQSNLISEKFCKKLKLHCTQTNLSIMGINQVVSQLNKKCNLSLFSNTSNYNCTIDCFVSPIITNNIPSCHVSNVDSWNIPKNILLSDPQFYISREIDLLIGAGLFWDLILDGKINLSNNLPSLQNTHFGYIVTGILPFPVAINSTSICNFSKIHIPEDDQLKKFWELEEVKITLPLTKDDSECEIQFENDTFRDKQGQFVVKFPLKHSPNMLGNSKEIASKRFLSLEKKFTDPDYKNMYFDFIHEYESLGHMTKVLDSSNNNSNISYFLPHHGVLKVESITTKLRTVFDASCPSSSGWSLNDIQYVGPKVQNDIIDIILRFRIHKYVVSADISKMYRCILMNSEHKPLQQILWRENPNDEFSVYQLNTVSYGTRSAPYLAIKCLKELANQNFANYPQASQIIHNDFYVDDLLTGSNDLTELKIRCKEIYSILESGHFILRKWVSNDAQVISDISPSNISNSVLNLGKNESCKTLGIQWVPVSDNLKYNIKQSNLVTNKPVTKRNILSIIAQIYDPLNLLSPVIITFKLIIQRLWSLKIPWDSLIPSDLEKLFIKCLKGLPCLNDLFIPRTVIPEGYKLVDIHCFCDASKDAYACSIYVRSKDIQGNFQVHLLCAKSKVAPLKTITIPKLELCASLLGSQLIQLVKNALSLSVPIIMWSDSQVALSWIGTEPSLLQVFVANRVSKIQSCNLNDWRYVNTKDNPADLATRGVQPESLLNSTLWWTGPSFLKINDCDWPVTNYSVPYNQLPELKKKITILQTTSNENCYLFLKFSNLLKLRRITALCIRFYNNLKSHKNNLPLQTGTISVSELNNANESLIRLAQSECFISELNLLNKNCNLDKKHKLSSLAPFVDTKGIMRVGGRLKNTYLSYEVKHPVLLHSNHPFTKLVFDYKHKQLLHPGPQLLLASIRQFYWPVGGLNLAKKTVKNCMICFKFNPTPASCPMASLPDNRIKPGLPFKITGLDYAGPFFILNKPGKGAKLVKCYLAVFICFCTKAVHLEIVSSLTTESFLACLKRFTSRRGLPSQIFSDNGSTFIGAKNELKDLGHFLQTRQGSIIDSTSQDNIHWVFIPPYTPNFGGLWEAAVKSAKHHLKRALINHNVTFEEFNTLVIQVEGILNSRPLFSMSNDPNDLAPITPSHFLIGRPLNSVPELDLQEIKFNRLTRIQHVQKLCQQFWSQFSKHYISQLHAQYKWKEGPTEIRNGALVLLRNEKQPPYMWSLGRVIQQFPSKDGISRVAEILTKRGKISRSTRHLCPLPSQEDIDN